MERNYKHPDANVERLLEDLERQGVEVALIEAFAKRATERRRGNSDDGLPQKRAGQQNYD